MRDGSGLPRRGGGHSVLGSPPSALPRDVAEALARAYHRLGQGRPVPVAVRSSALEEDLPEASFAGQAATWLNVQGLQALERAVLACWASSWSPGAVAYRTRARSEARDASMAVLVQVLIPCEASGVAFSQDPLGAEDVVLVEATWGLGQGVVGGQGAVDRWWLDRATLAPAQKPQIARKEGRWGPAPGPEGGLRQEPVPPHLQKVPSLTPAQVEAVAALALRLETLFGAPQDVEFGFWNGDLVLLQSRPVTAGFDGFFEHGPADPDRLWTAGFVNERFPQPVSPLGWTLVRSLLEDLAFRQPLAYLGVHDLDGKEITRLRRGHPYVDVQVFQHIYKVFPDALLPEDAARFFPRGEVALRRKVARPRGLGDPTMWASLGRVLLRDWRLWSPWHNYGRWMAFEEVLCRRLEALAQDLDQVLERPAEERPQALWSLVESAQALSRDLLAIHRWSLTLADVLYTLLRRACLWVAGPRRGAELAAALVGDVETVSFQMNQALGDLAARCRAEGGVDALQGEGAAAQALAQFLRRYGHRSYSLDLYVPPFGEDPSQVVALVAGFLEGTVRQPGERVRLPWEWHLRGWRGWKAAVLRALARLTRRYVWLREEQRFAWQKVLAFQRRAFLAMGRLWAEQGSLPAAERIFFATLEEVREAALGKRPLDTPRLARRWRTFQRLCQDDARLPPSVAYPPFLQGQVPLEEARASTPALTGVVVCPGLVQGPVRLVRCPADLARVHPGDILVAPALDPGWTPVFARVAGLVLESGGQLS
ncbi:MAG: PEP/pyruvate-binding domain-containing protein, partial [Anaerolineae bacterium]